MRQIIVFAPKELVFPTIGGAATIHTHAVAFGEDWIKAVRFGTPEADDILDKCDTVVVNADKLAPIVKLAYRPESSQRIFVHPGKDASPNGDRVRDKLMNVVRGGLKEEDKGEHAHWDWFCDHAVGFSRGGNEPDFRIPEIHALLTFLGLGDAATMACKMAAFEALQKLPARYETFRLRDRARTLLPLVIGLLAVVTPEVNAKALFPDVEELIEAAENSFAREIGRDVLEGLRQVRNFIRSGADAVSPQMAALIEDLVPKLRPPIERLLFRSEIVQ